ncbi:MAG: CPBP family intramembrane glutamic endopeptidase [Caulobacterales bacterium]
MNWAKQHGRALTGLGVYLLIWGAATAVLAAGRPDTVSDAVAVFVIMGVVFSGLAWLLTLGEAAPAVEVKRPGLELTAVLGYLALYAVLFTGWGLSAFHAAFAPGRGEAALLVLFKLVVHVVLPALLLLALGAQIRPLIQTRIRTRGFWLCLTILGAAVVAVICVISDSLKDLAGLHAQAPTLALAIGGAFVWMAIEAGLCEEFLFRAVLQTRLAAVLQSEAAAVVIGALIFGLVHVPGLWLRSGDAVSGHSKNLIEVIAYAIAVLSPAGLFLGFVWARTRSLLLVVLIHALVDVLPNTAEFAKTWLGL